VNEQPLPETGPGSREWFVHIAELIPKSFRLNRATLYAVMMALAALLVALVVMGWLVVDARRDSRSARAEAHEAREVAAAIKTEQDAERRCDPGTVCRQLSDLGQQGIDNTARLAAFQACMLRTLPPNRSDAQTRACYELARTLEGSELERIVEVFRAEPPSPMPAGPGAGSRPTARPGPAPRPTSTVSTPSAPRPTMSPSPAVPDGCRVQVGFICADAVVRILPFGH
jgi:hypothetical protein